jgi:hypothetical protein
MQIVLLFDQVGDLLVRVRNSHFRHTSALLFRFAFAAHHRRSIELFVVVIITSTISLLH